jgi:hypothetical protein
MKKFCLALFILISLNTFSQSDPVPPNKNIIDTTAMLDSMAMDLAMLKDLLGGNESYFNVNMSLGNQLFSKNNYSLNSQQSTENVMSFKPGAGYYHKSGLSVSGLGYLNLSNSKGGFYQYSVTPAYDYNGSGKLAGGISYTHYFTKAKDTIPDFATPYDNEFYGYLFLTKGAIQPGLTLGYATGKFTNVFRGRVQGPQGNQVFVIDSQKTKQADFSISASVQHDFNWYDVLSANDGLSFTPTLMLNAGSSNTTILSHSNKLVSNIVAKRPNNRFRIVNEGFQFYSLGLSLNLMYEIGKFYVQPEAYFDYYLLESDKKFTSLFSITAGFNF